MLITKATGSTTIMEKHINIGDGGVWLMNVLWAIKTIADTTQAKKNAIRSALGVPCLGDVSEIAEMMIPASAGPLVATMTNGASKN